MTDLEKRIAIAKIVGMKEETINARLDWEKAEIQFQCAEIGEEEYYRRHLRVEPVPVPILKYTKDLNSIQFALRRQDSTFQQKFEKSLLKKADEKCVWIHALSANDWCDCFLDVAGEMKRINSTLDKTT